MGTSLAQTLHERRDQFPSLRLGEYLDPFNSAVGSFTEQIEALSQTGDPVASQQLAWQALDFRPLEQRDEDGFVRSFAVNVKCPFFFVQSLPSFANPASVVLNTSINSRIGTPASSVYSASKAALDGLVSQIPLRRRGTPTEIGSGVPCVRRRRLHRRLPLGAILPNLPVATALGYWLLTFVFGVETLGSRRKVARVGAIDGVCFRRDGLS